MRATRPAPVDPFLSDESGAMTAWNIFWVIIFLLTMGLAIDLTNAHRYRMALQATADSAALTAAMAYDRQSKYDTFMQETGVLLDPEDRARIAADAMAKKIMGVNHNKDVLNEIDDIEFGNWTQNSGFDPTGPKNHVRVVTRRSTMNDNQLDTIFLGLFGGLPSWDLAAVAVAQRYRPACERNGVITMDVVDFQSGNTWNRGICVHGERGVSVNQNNVYDWQDDVIVSLPSMNLLTVPGGDMTQNYGLAEALRFGSMVPQLALQTDQIIAGLSNLYSEWQPDYIDPNTSRVYSSHKNSFNPSTMVAGNIYVVNCASGQGNNTLNLRGIPTNGGGSLIQNVVIVTDCNIVFDSGTQVIDAIVATSSTNDQSVKGSSGVNIGRPDDCAPGGGAQIISAGGMSFAASMAFHGSQLVSKGRVRFAAQVSGMGGTSVQSLGRVELASLNDLSLCKGDADPGLESFYYRLVQ